jgi:hypothetical protein
MLSCIALRIVLRIEILYSLLRVLSLEMILVEFRIPDYANTDVLKTYYSDKPILPITGDS